MALVKNIAGFNVHDPFAVGVTEADFETQPTLFQNIVAFREKDSTGRVGFVLMAAVAAVKIGFNLLPEGAFKNWIKSIPLKLFAKIFQAIKGRIYTTGQYTLGERLVDQLDPDGSPDSIKSFHDVTDDAVVNAINLFTILFGVRITTVEDLDALQMGSSAYYLRPDKQDIPADAVARAVYLKQTFFPDSLYNKVKWDANYFSQYPLVAPIPDPYQVGQLYSGVLPGGAMATNGVILVDEQLSTIDPATGLPKSESGSGKNTLLLLGGALLAVGGFLYYQKNSK